LAARSPVHVGRWRQSGFTITTGLEKGANITYCGEADEAVEKYRSLCFVLRHLVIPQPLGRMSRRAFLGRRSCLHTREVWVLGRIRIAFRLYDINRHSIDSFRSRRFNTPVLIPNHPNNGCGRTKGLPNAMRAEA